MRQSLDGLREQMKNFPARLRQYASYEHIIGKLKSLIKANWIVVELKSATVKERHWKQLTRHIVHQMLKTYIPGVFPNVSHVFK